MLVSDSLPSVLLQIPHSHFHPSPPPTSNRHQLGQTLIPFTPTEGQEQGKMIIRPESLNIVWGGDKRYWNLPVEESSDTTAELVKVAYLDVSGSVKNINPRKDYEVGFSLSFNPWANGWDRIPIFIMVKRGKLGRYTWEKRIFDELERRDSVEFKTTLNKAEIPSENDPDLGELYFGLYEVWSNCFKSGLNIHHAFVKEVP